MSYLIKMTPAQNPARVFGALLRKVGASRFALNNPELSDGVINLGKVRLKEAKPYCGQHPGECFLGATRRGRWLEWDDWVEFHALVNDVLDELKIPADVTTRPMETVDCVRGLKGLFWIRKGERRRLRYEWREDWTNAGLRGPTRWWNPGTEDQFT